MNIRSILCPTDFSAASRHALDHAVAIAKWYSARVVLLHAHRPAPAVVAALVPTARDIDDVGTTEERRQLARAVGEMTLDARARDQGAEIVTTIVEGGAADVITEYAATQSVDLVVIGTHGASGLEHLVLGSVTETVLRRVTCPVLTVPPRVQATSRLPFKHILCPTDFSASSLAGLQVAFAFAQEGDASLTLLHVLDDPDENELFVPRPYDVHQHHAHREQHAIQHLDRLIPQSVRDWSSPRIRVVSGKAYEQILSAAEHDRADLIVVGVQGRKPLDLTLFGSTTNQVVRGATCPVLTVRR
ncbi:MAG TPA: universal stress protein [Vicinamibacterales bacterium]|nr:universal stress protein [Vicinamibacterales bacterium]